MVELQSSSKNKGFYVRMRLSHKQARQQEKNIFFKYYKWVLWFSLTLYFFTSYLISHKPNPISKSHAVNSKSSVASRALVESTNSTFFKHPRSHRSEDPLKGLKIFVYDLPSKYNADWLSNERCSNHLFASEVAIHKALLNSDVRTFDQHEADFFFVPVYVSCNFSTVNGFPAIGHARSLLASAVEIISSSYPFWNRSRGSDHVFVASHDYGACFHAMEDRAIADGIPEFMKNSIILQTFGVNYKHPCQEVENVVIPPYISPKSVRNMLEKVPANGRRDIWAFFRGKMEMNPKNVSGRYYSKKVRTVIWRKYNSDRRFYLQRHRYAGYQSEIGRSVFCLCPLGWAPWSPRLVESVALGCVPVIIADGIRLPFPTAVRWPDISLTVAEKDVGKLGRILEHVGATNLTAIQRNLWDPATRSALLFNDMIEEGDATWQVLRGLTKTLDRSYRRVSVSTQ
ncbi:glucuronoxylan glucuronosyltransferase IRX7-like isoform X1 [Tripterygium wilfordii]|uniref:Glucuronoxylan glucuronosyltransferase IRX7-like isoform X1 n=1 Tax=Tripterygium wilfordii TaxID=458696 RepID=A0A7J7DYY6_TRIWF|nr:probable glucuronoxylan glucuronosyltransferase IRX7 [Tripterygium wilfordii]KAF5751578.1 glucuronoxylan glucuronosyltransferase IRX7-like isoform X1 [Tripterygium wilfordii]